MKLWFVVNFYEDAFRSSSLQDPSFEGVEIQEWEGELRPIPGRWPTSEFEFWSNDKRVAGIPFPTKDAAVDYLSGWGREYVERYERYAKKERETIARLTYELGKAITGASL
jgi:hypothetical protein